VNIIDAIHNADLFKPCFKNLDTWRAWLTLLKALFGLSLTDQEMVLFEQCTGRKRPSSGEYRELWAIVGRRGGKSFVCAVTAVYLALFRDFKKYLSAGEHGVILIIAADRHQAQVILNYCKGILHSNPVFEQYIENELRESIALTNGIIIEVMSCSYRAIRGRTVVCGIFDEVSFWRIDGANPSVEVLAALRPSMSTIPNSKLLVISSPYARSGILYDHHREYFGSDDPDILVWLAPSRVMNPTISQQFIDKEISRDEAARAEWLAEFRKDIEDYMSREALEACVLSGVREIGPMDFTTYRAFVDPSGGARDSFTLAIAHRENGKRVLDCVREARPPFSPDTVCSEYSQLLKQYRVRTVNGDRYAGEWPRERFSAHGIIYKPSARPKSDLYRDLLPLVNSGQVSLIENERLSTQLLNLERRTSRSGKDSIDHPPRGQDDVANAAAGALVSWQDGFFSECMLND
jgi:hypothetical protein